MSKAYETKQVGRYRVEVHHEEEWRNLSRDADNVGRISIPGPRLQWDFQDDTMTYREAREHAGEPIVAIPLDVWDQSHCIVRTRKDWDGADGFYWAPWSAIEREGWADGVTGMLACMEAEIAQLASELEGNVWGYVVIGPDGQEESCWGFVGGDDYAMAEGVDVAEWCNERDAINWAAVPEWVQQYVLIREEVTA